MRSAVQLCLLLQITVGTTFLAKAQSANEFALIHAGSYQMGCEFPEALSNELPTHTVFVSSFFIAKHETTKAVWDEVRTWGEANGYTDIPVGNGKGPNHPVQMVSWYAVVKWCNARSEKEGVSPCYTVSGNTYKTGNSDAVVCNWSAGGYRLPTEAEWEKAARGGVSGRRFPWGNTISQNQANFASGWRDFDGDPNTPPTVYPNYDTSSAPGGYHPTYAIGAQPFTSPVGSFGANGYGLYDTAGNVHEWFWDWYSGTYYSSSPGADPRGPTSGPRRMGRGGGWDVSAQYVRIAYRGEGAPPGLTHPSIGFRVARSSNVAPSIGLASSSGITAATVTLRATMNPNGNPSTASFDYGTTTTYGNTATVTLTPDNGTTDQDVEAALTNLLPNTTYHYRIRAQNSAGTATGQDMTFTTLPTPIVFIPGIAGSMLIGGSEEGKHGNGAYLWPSLDALDIRNLNLRTGRSNVKAVAVLREYDPGYFGVLAKTFYGPFLDFMVQPAQGYSLFDLDEYPDRMTTEFQTATTGLLPVPTLFPFPYDWRRSNADHVANLAQYIDNISQLHGGAKVNVVAHSMGGLLLRRYVLEHGSAKIDKVVTVGTPFWGAPVAIYRMLQGDFYNIPYLAVVDWWNNAAIKESLATFPAFHELLPSSLYLQNATGPVLSENGWDFDNDHVSTEDYSTAAFRAKMDTLASPDTPSTNNLAFHGYLGGRQDDWRTDDGAIKYLHIYGDRPNNTTVRVKVVPEYNGGSINRGNLDLESAAYPKFMEVPGDGDGVVPTLSSHRLGSYTAPGAIYQPITAGGDDSEHTGMMKNVKVQKMILDFLDDGQLTPSAAPVVAAQSTLSATGRRTISVRGVNYVRVSDALGNTNTKLNDSVARRVPGVEIRYGGSQPWVDIDCAADQTLFVESDALAPDMEIVVNDCDSSGNITGVSRYRYQPNTSMWRLGVASAQAPDLKVDQNNNGNYESGEQVVPTHTASGGSVDTTAPTVAVNLAVVSGNLTVTLTGSDGAQPAPTIHYTLGSGPLQTYAEPLVFSASEARQLKVLAEDAMGNFSGLIETAINPLPSISSATGGTVRIEWPISEAYVLEESSDLVNWSPSTAQISKASLSESVSVPIGGDLKKFFRLRSQPITK